MATVKFTSPIDLSNVDLSDWFDVKPTNATSTSMTFATDGQTVNVTGTGFEYFFGYPTAGTVTSLTADGAVDGAMTNISVTVGEIADAIGSDDPAAAMADLLFGGKDRITGSTGSDILYGFDASDKIAGGKGADFIAGGAGADVLTGDGGADTFVFLSAKDSTNTKADRITDLGNIDIVSLAGLGVKKLGD
ncbi:MAG: calcium-binding protein, partial [Caulobacteraceae bacterium]